MEEQLRRYFNLDNILDPYAVPTVAASRVGYMETLPGDLVRYWVVLDHQHSSDGFPTTSEVVAKFVLPIQVSMTARGMVNAWFASKGLNVPMHPRLIYPDAQRPKVLM